MSYWGIRGLTVTEMEVEVDKTISSGRNADILKTHSVSLHLNTALPSPGTSMPSIIDQSIHNGQQSCYRTSVIGISFVLGNRLTREGP